MKTDQTPLHDALAELATTMSANPDRLRQVRDRVDRRRRRRMATGAAVSAGAVAAAVGIAMVPREPRAALQFNVEGPSLPTCASVPAPAPTPTPPAAKTPSAVVDREPHLGRYKGTAVVTAVGAGTVTLGELVMGPVAVPPSGSIVLTVDSTTTFENRGSTAAASDIVVGKPVIFAASVGTDGRDHLDHLDLSADIAADPGTDPTAPAKGADADAAKAALAANDPAAGDKEPAAVPDASQAELPSGAVVTGKAVIDAAPANNEVLVHAAVDDRDVRSMRLLLGPATQYFRFETVCTSPALVGGTGMLFSAVSNGDGTYTATEIRIYE